MAHPPNPPGGVAPARATTGQQGGGTPAAQTPPSGPTRKVKVVIVGTLPTPTFHIHDVMVTVVDRDGNPVTESVRVAISGISVARQVTATNGSYTEQVSVPAGLSGVVYRAVLANGEMDSKDLSAPAVPAQPHHQTKSEKALAIFYAYGLKIASVLAGLIAVLFFKAAIFGPYGIEMGEDEKNYLVLGGVFLVVAFALFYKAFGGGHTPSGGGH